MFGHPIKTQSICCRNIKAKFYLVAWECILKIFQNSWRVKKYMEFMAVKLVDC